VADLGDIVRGEGARYLQTHYATPVQRKALRDIAQCRTEALGSTPEACDDCGDEYRLFCSCGNRSCPACGGEARKKWIEAREQELLPVPYLQVVFAVPRVLYVLARYCPKAFYEAVMHAAGQAVIDVGWSELHIQLGCYAQFHTWTQKMLEYLHVHCAVPAGGFSKDGSRWVSFEPRDLPAKALRKRFGMLLCRALEDAARKGKFEYLPAAVRIEQLLARARARRWKVYAQPPFGGPEGLVQYLARYMYRVAITNERIESYENHQVAFWCRNSAYYARRTAVSRAFSDARASERVRSIALVWVPRKPKPQAEERAGRAAHWAGEETTVPSTIQTSQALPSVRIQARHPQDSLCSWSRRGPSVRSSSPATADRSDSCMTLPVLCISHVSLDRTVGFEVARACAKSLHCVVAVGHLSLLERLFARSCDHRFLLYPYNGGRAAQLEVAPDETPDPAPGGRAASILARRAASRRLQLAPADVTLVAASGAPLSRHAPDCVSRVNL
jgi:Putative transposase/Transposase zinc-binding domain